MPESIGPLIAADEQFTHQIVDTHARVGTSERSWTEKVCAQASARDGSFQLALGLGKYTNRNVMDAYAGISRGVEQWTVRSSRALAPDPETATIGPIRYEVLEPLREVRFALDANDAQPIAFEWIFTGTVPASVENREVHVSRDRYRINADVIRYHHVGTARGWVELDGERTEFDDSSWISTRDHSWGVRYEVGAPVPDIAPSPMPEGASAYVLWFPVSCAHSDGTPFGLHFYYQRFGFGGRSRLTFEGGIEHANGKREEFVAAVPDLRFDDATRRFQGGTITVTMVDGTAREYRLSPVGATGFHLAAGLYGGYDDHYHGQWRGQSHLDGDYYPDCTLTAAVKKLRQHRLGLVRVEDPDGGVGYGDLQSIVTGPHPEIGLTEAGEIT
ncbi:MAG: hypothetical protein JWL73_861 [Actinomycetia bacterium]|nr:hypothetical protein [Actinomycetes bacterium]